MAGTSGVQKYAYDDVMRGLAELALTNNAAEACRRLKDHYGLEVNQNTLSHWKQRHPEDYQRIREQMATRIHAQIATEQEDLVNRYGKTLDRMAERLENEVDEIAVRDLPGAIKSLSTSLGISTDKSLLLRSRPTSIVERRDPGEILREIERIVGHQNPKPDVEDLSVPRRVQNLEPKAT